MLRHKSLGQLITPSEEEPLQVINRAPEELSRFYNYYPPEVIPVGNMDAESYNNNLTPLQPPNRQTGIVSALVHSALAPDVIPYPQLEIADHQIQQSSQNIDKTVEGALADAQSDMKGKNEPSAAIDDDSALRPPHLTDMGSNVHLYWIDELKRYLAKSNDTNCEVSKSTDAINLPLVDVHSKSCGNGLEKIHQQQRSASVSPLGSSPFSKSEIKEKLRKIFEVHISKQSSSQSSRQEERRGAISGPSGGSAFDECEVNDSDKTETLVLPLASISSTQPEKQTTKKQMSSPRQKYHGSPPPVDLTKSDNGASFFSTRGLYQTRSEFSGASRSSPTKDNSKKMENQEIQRQNQQSVSISLGFSQIGGDTRASGVGGLSSGSDECSGCTDVPAHSWFSHFGAAHQTSKTGALSSDTDECEYQKSQKNTHTVQFRGSDGSSSYEFRSYSFIGDSGGSEGSEYQSGSAHQFGGTADVSATGVCFDDTDESGSPKQVFSESNTNSASVTVNVTSERVEYKNQWSQQPHSSTLKSTEGQTCESRKPDFKSNRSSGVFLIQIDSDNVDDQKAKQSKEFEDEAIITGTPMPFSDYGDRSEDHLTPRPSEVVPLELGHPSLAPISLVASPDESDKPVQKNSQHQSSNTHSDPSSFAAVIQSGTCTTSQTVTSDALCGKLPNGKAGGNHFQSESMSFSEPHSLSPPKLVSNENKSDEQCSGRRDSRTFAMDLDNIDESSQSEDSNEEYSGRQENRSRLSSESTDSGLFLDNLFYTDNDDSLI